MRLQPRSVNPVTSVKQHSCEQFELLDGSRNDRVAAEKRREEPRPYATHKRRNAMGNLDERRALDLPSPHLPMLETWFQWYCTVRLRRLRLRHLHLPRRQYRLDNDLSGCHEVLMCRHRFNLNDSSIAESSSRVNTLQCILVVV